MAGEPTSRVPKSSERRASAAPDPIKVRFDGFELDEANATLLRGGQPVALAPTPFALLCALARQPAALLTKNALLDQVWGHQFVSESVLKTAISDLRTALGDDAREPRFVATVSRRGYRFIAETSPLAAVAQTRPSLPPAVPRDAPAFIGRAEALSQLAGAWDGACGGKREIVWLCGEPGIGKTTLIDHFVAGLGDVACARGHCVEHYGTGEPYLPFLEALGELCRNDPALVDLLRAVAPAWLLQLPWLSTAEERDALRRELAGVAPQRMLREMGELLDRYTERRPLLLVIEDLHWSDRATVHLIDHIARRRRAARLMCLASFRLAEVVALDHPVNPLRHELKLHGLSKEIPLDPFSETEVAEFLAQRAPALAGDEAFVRALLARTDGLPLFVASVAGDVVARGAQDGQGDAPDAKLLQAPVPDNLAAIIDHYIARLTAEQREMLCAAAVCGINFRLGTVAEVLEREGTSVGRICEQLVGERLWLVAAHAADGNSALEQPYSFRHALFRQVLYERTALAERAVLHRKVGAALERERAAGAAVAAAELAMHFKLGREPLNALRCYAEAAEAALARFSPEECMELTGLGLALLGQAPDGAERKALEIALGTLRGLAATRLLGAGNEARSALERAYALLGEVPQHPMRGRLLHGFGYMLCLRAEYAAALAVAERAKSIAASTHDPVFLSAACTAHGEVDFLQGRWRAARTWLERGLPLAEQLDVAAGDFLVDPQVALLASLAVPLLNLGLVDEGRACLARAHARALERRWPMARLVAIWHSALFEVRIGDADRVAALADEMRALVDEFALAHGRTASRWFRGWAQSRTGQPREGFRLIRDAFEENTRLGMMAGGSETLGYGAEALALAADWDAAERELEEALRFADRYGERVYLTQLHLTAATIARGRGDPAGAQAAVQRAVSEARAQEAPWLERLALQHAA